MDLEKLTVDEIKNGFHFDSQTEAYVCNHCGKLFYKDHVFPVNDVFYLAPAAVAKHIETQHGNHAEKLLHYNSKYNSLTDNQKDLLTLFNTTLSDKEIANKLNVSASTVRHHKFTFREKAKQAKLYLAIYESIFENEAKNNETIVPLHQHAPYHDERYATTAKEKDEIISTFFKSTNPLVLKKYPLKEKGKIVVLQEITNQFVPNKHYSEQQINHLVETIYPDYVQIRRQLIMYGFLQHDDDGSTYWFS